MSTGYDDTIATPRHPDPLGTGGVAGDAAVAGLASLVVLAAWLGASATRAGTAGVVALSTVAAVTTWALRDRVRMRSRGTASRAALVVLVIVAGAGARSASSWAAAVPHRLGSFAGWVTIVGDPARVGRATAVVARGRGRAVRGVRLRLVGAAPPPARSRRAGPRHR